MVASTFHFLTWSNVKTYVLWWHLPFIVLHGPMLKLMFYGGLYLSFSHMVQC
jgi:hypothetical protein